MTLVLQVTAIKLHAGSQSSHWFRIPVMKLDNAVQCNAKLECFPSVVTVFDLDGNIL